MHQNAFSAAGALPRTPLMGELNSDHLFAWGWIYPLPILLAPGRLRRLDLTAFGALLLTPSSHTADK